ncbi:MAG: hypothetical protein NTV75_02680 [Bacteroidia bacterium]|nr:hypothetical protein [Bacteroidia bacterium]
MSIVSTASSYYLNFKIWKLLATLVGFTTLLVFTFNELFVTEKLYYQSFGEQIAVERIANMIATSQHWQWVGYILASAITLIRVAFTASCLYVGCALLEYKINFRDLFKISILADFVFVASAIVKLAVLIFFKTVNNLEDLQFQPFSLMELFDRSKVQVYLVYLYSVINIFEIAYWGVLAWLLTQILERPFVKTFQTVLYSYVPGLMLWILFTMFITLNLST